MIVCGCATESAARNEAASAGRGALFSRSGPVVLQYAVVVVTGGAGRELSVYTCSNGQRRHRCHFDSGNGRGGGDTLGGGVRRPLQKATTLANHWHDLAQDKSSGQTAPANFRSGLSLSRRV